MLKLLFAVALNAFGATYYVATTGNDSNPGTQSSPFRHLSKGAAVARASDTVVVMDGTYDNEGAVAPNYVVTLQSSGSQGNPITFMAQNRGQAILDAMNTATGTVCNGASAYFNLLNASFVTIQGFVIQRGCDEAIHSNDAAHDITIKWNDLRRIANHTVTDQYGRSGIYLNATEYNFTFDGNVFHDIGRTDGQALLHFDHGLYALAKNLVVVNNLFYNLNRGYAIQLADGATNWLIAYNTFAFGNAAGEEAPIMFWNRSSGILIRNNIFYQPNKSALLSFNMTTTGSAFDHNLIFGASTIMSGSSNGIAMGLNQVGPNPLFVNNAPGAPDFRLLAGSPAIMAGVLLPGITTDYLGSPRIGSLDIGAFQFAGTPPPPPPTSSTICTPPVIVAPGKFTFNCTVTQ